MDDTQRGWLRRWHDILDEHFGADPKFDFEEAVDSPDTDFRMHFMTWGLPDESLLRCFNIFPGGVPLGYRAIEMRNLYRDEERNLSETEAIELFQDGLKRFARFSDDADLKKPFRVQHVASDKLNEATMYTDRVGIVFEDVQLRLNDEAFKAPCFLRETLYRLANSYEIVDYIYWPIYLDRDGVDPHQPIAKLVIGSKYYAMLDDEGPVLFIVSD